MGSSHHVRSVSVPSQSHSSAIRIEEELNKLKKWEEISLTSTGPLKAAIICSGLSSLGELYNCIQDTLLLPLTQQDLVHCQEKKWADDVLDMSTRFLDMCTATREILTSMKEQVKDLQSTLKRSSGKLSVEQKVSSYICLRKQVKKNVSKCVAALKLMILKSAPSTHLDQDQLLSVEIGALREVGAITITIFQSLLAFMCASGCKTRWSLLSKLNQKAQVAREGVDDGVSEVASVDAELKTLCQLNSSTEKVQRAQTRLEELEVGIDDLEAELDCIFKRLIQTRVSLLNILTY